MRVGLCRECIGTGGFDNSIRIELQHFDDVLMVITTRMMAAEARQMNGKEGRSVWLVGWLVGWLAGRLAGGHFMHDNESGCLGCCVRRNNTQ